MNKEDRNKWAVELQYYLERLFLDSHLISQGWIHKEGKNDRLVFDSSFFGTPFSPCVDKFSKTEDEIELHCGNAMMRNLFQTCNVGVSYPGKEILLFDDNASRVLRCVKLYPQEASAHTYSTS